MFLLCSRLEGPRAVLSQCCANAEESLVPRSRFASRCGTALFRESFNGVRLESAKGHAELVVYEVEDEEVRVVERVGGSDSKKRASSGGSFQVDGEAEMVELFV